MENLFDQIEKSFLERCSNHTFQKKYWNKIANELAIDDLLQDPRPSLKLAQHAGDMGLSLLTIVQAALIRNFLRKITEEIDQNNMIISKVSKILGNAKLIGAFAHSEDKNNPVILSPGNTVDKYNINGTKKYITGGINADFILLTTREKGNEKIENLLYLENNDQIKKSLEDLKLQYLPTTSHGKLVLNDYIIDTKLFIPITGKTLRKNLKVWSIIERTLITESLLGFLTYLYNRIKEIHRIEIINIDDLFDLLIKQKNTADIQIRNALSNKKLEESFADFKKIFSILNEYNSFYEKEKHSLPHELQARFNDLSFLDILKKP